MHARSLKIFGDSNFKSPESVSLVFGSEYNQKNYKKKLNEAKNFE